MLAVRFSFFLASTACGEIPSCVQCHSWRAQYLGHVHVTLQLPLSALARRRDVQCCFCFLCDLVLQEQNFAKLHPATRFDFPMRLSTLPNPTLSTSHGKKPWKKLRLCPPQIDPTYAKVIQCMLKSDPISAQSEPEFLPKVSSLPDGTKITQSQKEFKKKLAGICHRNSHSK